MKNINKQPLQIGVIGSAADLNYSRQLERVAEDVGRMLARAGATLIFGAEQDYDSLSSAACRAVRKEGGLAIGITYGRSRSIIEKSASAVIATGMERGGGRETAMVMSCDAVIAIGGGSGTLNEFTIAYQAGIPVVALKNTGGWSGKLVGVYLDERKRMPIYSAPTAREAVKEAVRLANMYGTRAQNILCIAATHGNERAGVEVMRRLERDGLGDKLSWIIGNERAYKKNKRCVDQDLNRSAPGNIQSKIYEEYRAAEILQRAKQFSYVLDVHSTPAQTGIFTIVTNPTFANMRLAQSLPIQRIVVWPSSKNKLDPVSRHGVLRAINKSRGPLTRFISCGVEIECGPKSDPRIIEQLYNIVRTVALYGITERIKKDAYEMYYVYGILPVSKEALSIQKSLREFTRARFKGEVFYPLLINRYKNTVCYKMKKITEQTIWKIV